MNSITRWLLLIFLIITFPLCIFTLYSEWHAKMWEKL